jgi:hypothetical protein
VYCAGFTRNVKHICRQNIKSFILKKVQVRAYCISMKNNKATELAKASKNLIWKLTQFREAQHGVMFQLTNPSLSFDYEFERSGKRAEEARIALAEAIKEVEDLSFEVLFDSNGQRK